MVLFSTLSWAGYVLDWCVCWLFQAKAPWIKHFYIDDIGDEKGDLTYILPGLDTLLIQINKPVTWRDYLYLKKAEYFIDIAASLSIPSEVLATSY